MCKGVPEVKTTYAVLQHSLKRVSLRAPMPGIRRTISLWVKKFLRTRLYICPSTKANQGCVYTCHITQAVTTKLIATAIMQLMPGKKVADADVRIAQVAYKQDTF